MQSSLFDQSNREIAGPARFALQNPQLLRVVLGDDVLAVKGAMVAFQGRVSFDHEAKLLKNGMSRSRIGETISHEKAYAALYRGSTTQKLQGRDDDRDRPWGCLEPLLYAQRRRRSG